MQQAMESQSLPGLERNERSPAKVLMADALFMVQSRDRNQRGFGIDSEWPRGIDGITIRRRR